MDRRQFLALGFFIPLNIKQVAMHPRDIDEDEYQITRYIEAKDANNPKTLEAIVWCMEQYLQAPENSIFECVATSCLTNTKLYVIIGEPKCWKIETTKLTKPEEKYLVIKASYYNNILTVLVGWNDQRRDHFEYGITKRIDQG